jgi:uncharacterized protein YbaP (TraB family)
MNKFQYPAFCCRLLVFVSLVIFSTGTYAQSLLWKIDAARLNSPSYIYGTIHIKDKRVFQFDKKVYEAMESCSAFAMEVDLNPDNMAGFAQRLMLPEGKTLQDIFKPEEYSLIKSIIEMEAGLDMSLIDRMKPFVLLSLGMNLQIAGDMEVTMDEFFYHQALQAGKRIIGLETLEEQVEMLEEIPTVYIADYFKNFHKGAEDLEEIIMLYCRAELDHLLVLMQEDKAMATLEKQLITKRNRKMVSSVIPLMKEQPSFIAVGAGHLPGRKGILRLLEKRGYSLTPVMVISSACGQ